MKRRRVEEQPSLAAGLDKAVQGTLGCFELVEPATAVEFASFMQARGQYRASGVVGLGWSEAELSDLSALQRQARLVAPLRRCLKELCVTLA